MTEILEKSGNFMRGKKWEPCIQSAGVTPEMNLRITAGEKACK